MTASWQAFYRPIRIDTISVKFKDLNSENIELFNGIDLEKIDEENEDGAHRYSEILANFNIEQSYDDNKDFYKSLNDIFTIIGIINKGGIAGVYFELGDRKQIGPFFKKGNVLNAAQAVLDLAGADAEITAYLVPDHPLAFPEKSWSRFSFTKKAFQARTAQASKIKPTSEVTAALKSIRSLLDKERDVANSTMTELDEAFKSLVAVINKDNNKEQV